MLHGHTKIDQVPVSDTGTGKTRPENVPIGYQRDFFFLIPGTAGHGHNAPRSSRTRERGKEEKIFSLSCSVL